MPVTLDHTIVSASDPQASAELITDLLGIPPAKRLGHFTVVRIGESSLDFVRDDTAIASRHFAFRVDEQRFDEILGRISAREIDYHADPFGKLPQQINRWDDGRGLYFRDPDGHLLEVITRSYGSGGREAAFPNPLLDR